MTSFAVVERAALVQALTEVSPRAPTLCAGWSARDLAAHVVVRERRPDTLPGVMLPAFAGWTDRVRRSYAGRPYPELIELIRTGPPLTSPFALPGIDGVVNLTEHFVHGEDVRRAQEGWQPRTLAPGLSDALWQSLVRRGRMFFRSSPVGIRLRTPDGGESVARRQQDGDGGGVTLTGPPAELTLYAFGRRAQALVTIDGPAEATERLNDLTLGI